MTLPFGAVLSTDMMEDKSDTTNCTPSHRCPCAVCTGQAVRQIQCTPGSLVSHDISSNPSITYAGVSWPAGNGTITPGHLALRSHYGPVNYPASGLSCGSNSFDVGEDTSALPDAFALNYASNLIAPGFSTFDSGLSAGWLPSLSDPGQLLATGQSLLIPQDTSATSVPRLCARCGQHDSTPNLDEIDFSAPPFSFMAATTSANFMPPPQLSGFDHRVPMNEVIALGGPLVTAASSVLQESGPDVAVLSTTDIPRALCNFPGCGKTFKRSSDRDRHENSVHWSIPGSHLCPIQGCPKSQGRGYRRSDKVTEHLWKKHANLGFSRG